MTQVERMLMDEGRKEGRKERDIERARKTALCPFRDERFKILTTWKKGSLNITMPAYEQLGRMELNILLTGVRVMKEKRLIITIGRQYGSGGSEIGTRLAKELNLGFYDKNILRLNADESGIKESYFHLADEKAGNKLLYRIISSLTPEQKLPSFGTDLISADNLFRFQSEVIKKLAAEENCIILGRCADYVLDGMDGLVRIFLYADLDARVRRIIEKGYDEPKEVRKNIKRVDKERREYHLYYTGRDWTSLENYDLMLNTASLGIDGCIRVIKNYLKAKGHDIG